jgi:hypothetical protein
MAKNLADMTDEQIIDNIDHAQATYNDVYNTEAGLTAGMKEAILEHLTAYLTELQVEQRRRDGKTVTITLGSEAWGYWKLLAQREGIDPETYLQTFVGDVDWLADEWAKVTYIED